MACPSQERGSSDRSTRAGAHVADGAQRAADGAGDLRAPLAGAVGDVDLGDRASRPPPRAGPSPAASRSAGRRCPRSSSASRRRGAHRPEVAQRDAACGGAAQREHAVGDARVGRPRAAARARGRRARGRRPAATGLEHARQVARVERSVAVHEADDGRARRPAARRSRRRRSPGDGLGDHARRRGAAAMSPEPSVEPLSTTIGSKPARHALEDPRERGGLVEDGEDDVGHAADACPFRRRTPLRLAERARPRIGPRAPTVRPWSSSPAAPASSARTSSTRCARPGTTSACSICDPARRPTRGPSRRGRRPRRDVVERALDGVDAVCHQAAMVGLGVDLGDIADYVAPQRPGYGRAAARDGARRASRGALVLASSMVVYGEGRYRCAEHGVVRPGPRAAPRTWTAGRFEPPCPACGARWRRRRSARTRRRTRATSTRRRSSTRSTSRPRSRRETGVPVDRAALPQRLRPADAARHAVRGRGVDLPLRARGGPRAAGLRGRRAAARLRPRPRRRARERARADRRRAGRGRVQRLLGHAAQHRRHGARAARGGRPGAPAPGGHRRVPARRRPARLRRRRRGPSACWASPREEDFDGGMAELA